ncbi:MAG: hypothetical protein IKR34_03100 [Candidatus Gastranaerophilales bacterium]|nr:hypothetical protein [Candidatus Gastranaerophilales bacterium]
MKKFILVVICLLLSNICFAKDSGVIKNKRGLILQALDDGALGYICPKWALDNDDCSCGQFVYFDFNYDFVDNQKFILPKNYYFYADGVYKYTNKDNIVKTVRKIKLISK